MNEQKTDYSRPTAEQFGNFLNSVKCSRGNIQIVLANGCFDLIHADHIRMLQGAKRLGGVNSFLVVGINSDNSIRDLKGENRPVIEENDRLECVRALGCVDYGFIFDSTDFSPFISKAKDCLYVKGSDYLKITLAEEDALKLSGGRWKTVDSGNKSTTSKIIEKIKKNS